MHVVHLIDFHKSRTNAAIDTRQFPDHMDKLRVDAIDGIAPTIAIDQTCKVRNARATVDEGWNF